MFTCLLNIYHVYVGSRPNSNAQSKDFNDLKQCHKNNIKYKQKISLTLICYYVKCKYYKIREIIKLFQLRKCMCSKFM